MWCVFLPSTFSGRKSSIAVGRGRSYFIPLQSSLPVNGGGRFLRALIVSFSELFLKFSSLIYNYLLIRAKRISRAAEKQQGVEGVWSCLLMQNYKRYFLPSWAQRALDRPIKSLSDWLSLLPPPWGVSQIKDKVVMRTREEAHFLPGRTCLSLSRLHIGLSKGATELEKESSVPLSLGILGSFK